MKNWDLFLLLLLYTFMLIWFGMWVQTKVDQYQLKQWLESSWVDGCHQCGEFEKNACGRDQLQGILEHPKIQ